MKTYTQNVIHLTIAGLVSITGLPNTYAADGGANGGGGNLVKLKPASAKNVKQYLEEVQDPLTYIFNELEISLNYQKNDPKEGLSAIDERIFEKLFTPNSQGRKINDQVLFYKPNIIADQPCYNHEGVKKPASIYNSPPGTICFSLKWMILDKKNLNSSNEFVQTMALAAHEYGHEQGLNEAEAVHLANLVHKDLDGYARMWSLWRLEMRQSIDLNVDAIAKQMLDLGEDSTIYKLSERDGAAHFCNMVEVIFRGAVTANNKYRDSREHGLSFLTMDDTKYLDAIFFRSSQLSHACWGGMDMLNEFHGRNEIPMAEVTKTSNPKTLAPGVLRRTTLDTPDLVKLELQDLVKETTHLLNVIKEN